MGAKIPGGAVSGDTVAVCDGTREDQVAGDGGGLTGGGEDRRRICEIVLPVGCEPLCSNTASRGATGGGEAEDGGDGENGNDDSGLW